MVLKCKECGQITTLTAAAGQSMLRELQRPIDRKVIECAHCRRVQFILGMSAIFPRARTTEPLCAEQLVAGK